MLPPAVEGDSRRLGAGLQPGFAGESLLGAVALDEGAQPGRPGWKALGENLHERLLEEERIADVVPDCILDIPEEVVIKNIESQPKCQLLESGAFDGKIKTGVTGKGIEFV